MRPEELRRGHWIVIALLLGAALAWVHGFWGTSATQTNAQAQLEMLLYRQPVKAADGTLYPHVRSITIYPPQEAGFAIQGAAGSVVPRKSVVTYNILTAAADRKGWYYKPAVSLVDDPYRPSGRAAANPNLTAQDYLKELSANREWIQYRYAWWMEPRWSYTLWMGGCVLLLGIVWPTVQQRLVAAGYGRAPEEREKRDSLWKRLFSRKEKGRAYSSSSSSGQTRPSPSSITLSEEELERIAQMEADLAGFASSRKEAGGEVEEPEPEIKKLNAGPLDVQAAPEAPKEEQDYGGEFYPTVAHGKKKTDPGK